MPVTLLTPSIKPFPCPLCGVRVRTITMEDGTLLTINEEPSPDGNIVPWPAPSHNAVAVGRRLSVPDDGPMWAPHLCR